MCKHTCGSRLTPLAANWGIRGAKDQIWAASGVLEAEDLLTPPAPEAPVRRIGKEIANAKKEPYRSNT